MEAGVALGELDHRALVPAKGVRLADEPSFAVGSLVVHPSRRQIVSGDECEEVEPRVMQVLVALARANGRVVSRDELTDCCWEGRVVGEDAINRVISRVRRIAAGIGAGSFKVETIRGVGCRLVQAGSAGPAETNAREADWSPTGFSRRTLIAAAASTAVAAGAGFWFIARPEHGPVPLAMQYYRRGQATRGQASLDIAEQGAAYFREATRIDPQFADAWGALAWSYRGLLEFGPRPDSARLRALCRSAARRALELDADNVEAQSALLLLKPFYGNWAEIEAGCRQLLQRHPGNSILEYNLAHALGEVGRWRAASPYFQAVAERERFWPLPHIRLVTALLMVGRIEEAEDLIEEGMKRFPRRRDYWLCKIRYLANSGRVAEALAFANDLTRRPAVGIEPMIDFEIMILQALADGSAQARREAVERVTATARTNLPYLPIAAVSAGVLGDLDASYSMLEGFYFGRGPWASGRSERPFTDFLFGASTDAVRRDPRFPALLRETGLESYWRQSGTIPDFRATA